MRGTSIIMPSYYRPELLNWGLYSLSKQECSCPFEIIVLNDGIHDNTEEICKKYSNKLNIKYVFTGQRNLPNNPKWRVPGVVFNEGVKLAQGDIIILSSPEIFHLNTNSLISLIMPIYKDSKLLTIPEGKDDINTLFLNHLRTPKNKIDYSLYNKLEARLNTKLPFCMGIKKERFYTIGGFDSALFGGYCFDDADFMDRLIESGCEYCNVNVKVIHLYNSRKDRIGLTNRNKLWAKNKQVYEKRKKERINEPKKSETIKAVVEIPKINKNPIVKKPPNCKAILSNVKAPEIKIGDKNKWHLEKIPKIAHFYWGNKELPYLRYLTIASFHKYNPDWEIKFYYPKHRQEKKTWTSYEHKYNIKIEKDYYEKLKELPITFIEMDFTSINIDNELPEVHKSDYLRWNLLANVGGLWSDMDIIYYDSMNKINVNQLHNKGKDTIICHEQRSFSIGFLLSSPDNDFYKTIWKKALETKYDPKSYQVIGVVLVNPLMRKFTHAQYPKTVNLSMKTVYNYNSHMLKTIYNSTNVEYIVEGSIGLHWYAGYPSACKLINEMTHENYKEFNNVISKVVDISLNEKKDETIAINRGMMPRFIEVKKRKPLTIHAVCKNEPFIYYAIKSVYDYADKVLLYDTGTTDKLALEGIKRLLKEDKEKKIVYKIFDIGDEEEKVVATNKRTFPNKKFGVGQIRQTMIDDTDTDFCLTVDGDEVFYKDTMEKIVNEIIPNCPEDKYQIGIPVVWFADINHTCDISGNVLSGRLLKTSKVCMSGSYPDEYHANKETGEIFTLEHKNYWIYKNVTPFCHFNLVVKPEKRQHQKRRNIKKLTGKLPEVMEEEPYFIEKLLKERNETKK